MPEITKKVPKDNFGKHHQTQHNCSTLAISNNNIRIPIIAVKVEHNIEEYSFSQTTLEQVFIKFAKDQEVDEEDLEDVIGDH
jgi:hypothetical protein